MLLCFGRVEPNRLTQQYSNDDDAIIANKKKQRE